jgi:hypothetical protein
MRDTELEQRIRERAFQLWIEEGKPHGKDREHWERAEREVKEPSPPTQPGGVSSTNMAVRRCRPA